MRYPILSVITRLGGWLVVLALAGVVFLGPSSAAIADSSLTSAEFYRAYLDQEMVRRAKQRHALDLELCDFLADDGNDIGIRLAVVNAAGWNLGGSDEAEKWQYDSPNNGKMFREALAARGWNGQPDSLPWGTQLVLAYVQAMGDYLKADRYLDLATQAAGRSEGSLAAKTIHTLIYTQENGGPCEVWAIWRGVADNAALKRDFRDGGMVIINTYLEVYDRVCELSLRR